MPVRSAMTETDFAVIQRYIEEQCGIHVSEAKKYLVADRLSGILKQEGCSTHFELCAKARRDGTCRIRDAIVEAMTVNETLWFRDTKPFRILSEKVLPELASDARRGVPPELRIWSAACSSGQEPYSIAMTVLDFCRKEPVLDSRRISITATDISAKALRAAKEGVYDGLQMARGLSAEMRERHFERQGKMWRVRDEVRNMVRFRQFNLLDGYAAMGRTRLIFCRNVLIYFAEETKRDVLERMAEQLGCGGLLITGCAESVIYHTEAYQMEQFDGSLYYSVRCSAGD